MAKLKRYKQVRRSVLDCARAMNGLGINQGMSGNVSARAGTGFIITPSGMDYDVCTPDDLVWLDLDRPGEAQGGCKPSSEWRFHHDIYANRPDAGAVVHTHAVHATALACLGEGIPRFHYMVAMAGGDDIRCAPYATYGTQELSDHALKALTNRKACLLANHGLLVLDQNLDRALALAVEVETLARQYLAARSVGKPKLLTRAEMALVVDKFKGYGANAQSGPKVEVG
ncbi:MAG: class II aldolase/adducin family protein [Magnetovibrionaceae bacterium]